MSESRPSPFEGDLVRLRAWEPADYAPLNALFDDPDVLDGLGSMFPQSVEGFRSFVETGRGAPDRVHFAIEVAAERTPVGGCSLFGIEIAAREATLGIWVGKPYWNRGYGTDAVRTLCRFGFRQMNLYRIELGVYSRNPRAVRTYEKAGFVLEGTRRGDGFHLGRRQDSYLMSVLADELRG